MITLDSLIVHAVLKNDSIVAVASAADLEVLQAVSTALEKELASFILFDDEKKLKDMIRNHFPQLSDNTKVSIFHAMDSGHAATLAVKAVSNRRATVLMKGNLATSAILKAVLNSEYGLRTGKVLSHVAVFEVPGFDRLLFVTDAAMNIEPDLEAKAQIIRNSVATANACGVQGTYCSYVEGR